MPDPFLSPVPPPPLPALAVAQGLLPLQGLTILAVEDSRFASEALRLMCQRAGARLRRAETLAAARAHLAVYRPDVVIVDIGLPDGEGTALIADLAATWPRGTAILGTSGDPATRAAALAAGADGFLPKPVERLADFLHAVLALLPEPPPLPFGLETGPTPDPMALIDDLRRAEGLMAAGPPQRWLRGFLAGIAGQAHDPELAAALPGLGSDEGRARLKRLLHQRIADSPAAFGAAP